MPNISAVCIFCNFNKFVFSNSQGSAATQLSFGEKYYLYFVGNFMRFQAVKNCENMLRFDKVTADYTVYSYRLVTVGFS